MRSLLLCPGRKQVITFAKLNLMLSSDCSQIGTDSSNSPRSAKQSRISLILRKHEQNQPPVAPFSWSEGYRRIG